MLVLWVVRQCGLVGRYQRFGGTYSLHLPDFTKMRTSNLIYWFKVCIQSYILICGTQVLKSLVHINSTQVHSVGFLLARPYFSDGRTSRTHTGPERSVYGARSAINRGRLGTGR
jgi:hypothetical protein